MKITRIALDRAPMNMNQHPQRFYGIKENPVVDSIVVIAFGSGVIAMIADQLAFQHARLMQLVLSNAPFVRFKVAETALWIIIGFALIVRGLIILAIKHSGYLCDFALGCAFFLLASTDLYEADLGTWRGPWWLWTNKAIVGLVIAAGCIHAVRNRISHQKYEGAGK